MNRLKLISDALEQLSPNGVLRPDRTDLNVHAHISRSMLLELTDCLYYVCFPEVSNPPSRLTPTYVDGTNLVEWVLTHVVDIMISQITFAFILHGDVQAVAKMDAFAPLESSQRTPLSWGVPQGVALAARGTGSSVTGASTSNTAAHSAKKPDDVEGACDSTACAPEAAARARFLARCHAKAEAITAKFLRDRLPHVRWLLHTDVECIFKNDVAATSPSEVVLCYPAVRCMLHQRFAHQLFLLGVPTNFTRMLTEIAHSLTGIDIHPRTSIGHHFFIDHGTGIVIGATAVIGNFVSVYQGVTLGAKSFPTDKKTGERILNLPRHPVLEDGVTIYANTVVLGRVTIGQGSTIGGNCWIVRDVPPFTTVVQKPNRVLLPNERMFLENNGSGI